MKLVLTFREFYDMKKLLPPRAKTWLNRKVESDFWGLSSREPRELDLVGAPQERIDQILAALTAVRLLK